MPSPYTLCTLSLAALLLCTGCSATPTPASLNRWIASQGGLIDDAPPATRLYDLAQPLVDQCTAGRGSLHVLAATTPGAYAWPDGRIFVTRGLVDLLDDRQLTAAVAHELGHLLADPHFTPPATLRGHATAKNLDEESRADATGTDVLRATGADPTAMREMLQKLSTSPAMTPWRRSLTARLQHLEN